MLMANIYKRAWTVSAMEENAHSTVPAKPLASTNGATINGVLLPSIPT